MDSKAFREKLVKIMPSYNWTVHKSGKGATQLTATGIQSSGFNRLSTLEVSWKAGDNGDWFTVRSAGFGRRAPWGQQIGDVTLARALRCLQDHYRAKANDYHSLERALENGRKAATEAAA